MWIYLFKAKAALEYRAFLRWHNSLAKKNDTFYPWPQSESCCFHYREMRLLAQVMHPWMILWQPGRVKAVPGTSTGLWIGNTGLLWDCSKTVNIEILRLHFEDCLLTSSSWTILYCDFFSVLFIFKVKNNFEWPSIRKCCL